MEPARFGAAGWLTALGLAAHTVAAAAYAWIQPGGFVVLSPAFLEHQVIAPALLAISFAALVGSRRRATAVPVLGVALLAGFWMVAAAAALAVGTTLYAGAMWTPFVGAAVGLALSARRARDLPLAWLLHACGILGGAALAAGFLACTWAPEATTRPSGATVAAFGGPADATPLRQGELEASVLGAAIEVRRGDERVLVYPAMEFEATSPSGHWTVFDHRRIAPGGWRVVAREESRMLIETPPGPVEARALISLERGRARIACASTLRKEIAAHLASAVTVGAPGEARLEGISWRSGHGTERVEFVAFRERQMEFVRAARGEKGPFETVSALKPRDPRLEVGGWSITVHGWMAQASRSESPTAGWGVSQGTIERSGDHYFWSLAQTSIGRGWHSVRTAAGTYRFEIDIAPPAR